MSHPRRKISRSHGCEVDAVHAGSCLCGAVTYQVDGPLRAVINCHCGQCRKWSGHYVAATAAWNIDLTIVQESDGDLAWYQSSEHAQRGFCRRCGSALFWRHDGLDTTSIYAGTLDGPTGLETRAEIFVEDKGDYYSLVHPAVETYAQSGHNIRLESAESGEGSES